MMALAEELWALLLELRLSSHAMEVLPTAAPEATLSEQVVAS